ncbi:MAG: DUF2293 domain-containing protein [Prolixibacteraceae bacterium]|nr:DUF2293 domain-containing protein [Prolixibacteraceae bacterium]
MDSKIRIVQPGEGNKVMDEKGVLITPPDNWAFLAAGDAGITRKITAKGEYWRVQFKKGRRMISKGIWAPKNVILQARHEVEALRKTDTYQKKKVSELKRREKKQDEYSSEFYEAVVDFLGFHEIYCEMGKEIAKAVTLHAIPIGSGTVARTQMIPIEGRAAKAVIAWMRHKTSAYDHLKIARIKGERRAVRRAIAQQSDQLLETYRQGKIPGENCPLKNAVNKILEG